MAFAIECFEEGVLTRADTDGLELRWGDSRALEELLRRIVAREGIGDLLADGVKRASKRLGKGSYRMAVHAGGQELPMHHPLAVSSLAAAYATEPAIGRHSNSSVPYALTMDLFRLYPEIFDGPLIMRSREKLHRYRAHLQAASSCYIQVINAAGLCLTGVLMGGLPQREWINAATGWNLSPAEILTVGRRILTLKQAFTIREGVRLSEIKLPLRALGRPKHTSGPLAHKEVDLDRMRRAYCRELGWHPVTGEPQPHVLDELGLLHLYDRSDTPS
jgi:aldehyde:ferredoxin oxidoreductase